MQDQQWNELPINRIAKRLLIKMGKEANPEMMHATQFLTEFLEIPTTKRGQISKMLGGEETISLAVGEMLTLPHQQQAERLASSWEGGNLEERLEALGDRLAGKSQMEAGRILLESLAAHLEQE